MNQLIVRMAKQKGHTFLDAFPVLADVNGFMAPQYSSDGVHPNCRGYIVLKHYLVPILHDPDLIGIKGE